MHDLLKEMLLFEVSTRQTETDEFKKWFGDSKVVDENGDPLVVYHGTAVDFDTFKKSRKKSGNAYDRDSSVGMFFSSDPEQADYFAFIKASEKKKVAFSAPTGQRVMPVYLNIENPFIVDWEGRYKGPEHILDWSKQARKAGNDGLIIRDVRDAPIGKSTDLYIVFQPTQIKSATGNKGTFKSDSDNIVESSRL